MPPAPKDTSPDHFLAVNLGLAVRRQPDPYRLAVAVALGAWKFISSDREFKALKERGLGLDGIRALTGMSESKAKAVLNQMEKNKEVQKIHGRRDLGERTTWVSIEPPMTWALAKRILTVRLPQVRTVKGQLPLLESVQLPQGQTVPDRPDTTNRASGSAVSGSPSPQVRTNIKGLDQVLDQREDLPADAGDLPSFQEPLDDADRLRLFFAGQYEERHHKRMSPPSFDWRRRREEQLVRQDGPEPGPGLQALMEWTMNYLQDPNLTAHSYRDFLSDPDKWTNPRPKFGAGGRGGHDEYAPKRRPLTAAQQLLRDMGGEVDDES